MAHKKGVGSSKNGRESHSKRLGVKIFGGQPQFQATLLYVSVVHNTTQETTLESVKIIRCLH